MKIVIDIPDGEYELDKWLAKNGMGSVTIRRILDGTPLPEGAEILTAEAYSDLCLRASNGCKTGKWIEKDGWDGDVYYDCSACGESWTTIEGTPWDNGMNYCPHCGAKMEGAE